MSEPRTAAERVVDELRRRWRPEAHPLHADPAMIWRPLGMQPDPWQERLIRSSARQQLVLCSRQSGKSMTAAACALVTAMIRPSSTTVIISRSQRQAAELLRKAKELHRAWRISRGRRVERPTPKWHRAWRPAAVRILEAMERELDAAGDRPLRDAEMSMELANGARIISLPCSADTVVGYAVDLLILDEAARIPDEKYKPLRPMLAIAQSKGRGRLMALSTPHGKRGWFWEAWRDSDRDLREGRPPVWEVTKVTAPECPRLSEEFLGGERRDLGSHWYDQEYLCIFRDAVDSLFNSEDIEAAMVPVAKAAFEDV